jgi:hypothetical protein
MVTECGYPEKNNPEHWDAVRARLHQALNDHQSNGGRVEEGSFHLTLAMQTLTHSPNQAIFPSMKTT